MDYKQHDTKKVGESYLEIVSIENDGRKRKQQQESIHMKG